jgi:hypothetical protein
VPAVVAGLVSLVAIARAQDSTPPSAWMSGDMIRSEFAGHNLAGHYPNGARWTEQISADGTTDYREGEKHWLGQWWARPLEFCFSYPAPGIGGCFRIVRVSANCFELYDFSDQSGSGDTPPTEANRWNGRLWYADIPTTCEERPTV